MAAVHYHLGAFPPAVLDWPHLIPLLGPASAAVARYDGTLAAIPNAAVLLSPLTTQEAVLSSRIEGTQATMGEVLEFEAEGGAPELSEARRCVFQRCSTLPKAGRHFDAHGCDSSAFVAHDMAIYAPQKPYR